MNRQRATASGASGFACMAASKRASTRVYACSWPAATSACSASTSDSSASAALASAQDTDRSNPRIPARMPPPALQKPDGSLPFDARAAERKDGGAAPAGAFHASHRAARIPF
jgi:hypothetical protein